ncbi:filaggrin [Aplysia californica]|uniref:Filaggrin n=1 Tax=Aplysia californica TaxID=6500 RepID=A0ABM0K9C9_APLCA|nr:filaggrin [Aplysia californica]
MSKMSSSYTSYRRRYSEPEKPQPRFQWRLRVNSLMMDEGDHAPSRVERGEQRVDGRRRLRSTEDKKAESVGTDSSGSANDSSGRGGEAGGRSYEADRRGNDAAGGAHSGSDRSEAERRRDRYTRTQSEGQLKLRVRFSREAEESHEEEADESCAENASVSRGNRERRLTARSSSDEAYGGCSSSSPQSSVSPAVSEGGTGRGVRERRSKSRSLGLSESPYSSPSRSDSGAGSKRFSQSSVGSSDGFSESFDWPEEDEEEEEQEQGEGTEQAQLSVSPPKDDKATASGCSPGPSSTTAHGDSGSSRDLHERTARSRTEETSAGEARGSVSTTCVNVLGETRENLSEDKTESVPTTSTDDHPVAPVVEPSPRHESRETPPQEGACGFSQPGTSENVETSNVEEMEAGRVQLVSPREETLGSGGVTETEKVSRNGSEQHSLLEENVTESSRTGKFLENLSAEMAGSLQEKSSHGAGTSSSARGCPDDDDDGSIERILEQIMAEEEEQEALEEGKGCSARLLKASLELMSGTELDDLKRQARDFQQAVSECNEELVGEEAGEEGEESFQNVRRHRRRHHLSSSSDDDREGEEEEEDRTVVPYSRPGGREDGGGRGDGCEDDDDDEEEEEEEFDTWAELPVILLEDVFTLLTPKERHQASQVCRQWYDLFYSPRVWETFILLERTLTKKRFNLYKGYQQELCPGKTQLCFRRVGSFFKRIVVTPITDYFNLYEFLRILAAFLQFQEDHGISAMPLLHTFDFTFACATRGYEGLLVHGTGGQILEMIKELLCRMSDLKHLKLNQLLIDVMETSALFDGIVSCFGDSLHSLEMLNVTKVPLALPDLARFRNLLKLTVSPQHLNEEVLLLLSGLSLLHLHLLQDPYTCECEPVSYEAWKLVKEMSPWLRVYLEVSGITKSRLLIQPRAPVHGIFLRTPYSRVRSDLVMSIVEHYSKTLNYFVQERLPRVHGPRGFESRCDSSLLFLVRRCPSLRTLVIRERISTSTLILLANESPYLSTLLVRQNALIKRCDWPRHGEWSRDFYERLRGAALDYDRCTDEVCRLLRRRWRPLSDKQFMRLKIVPRMEMF